RMCIFINELQIPLDIGSQFGPTSKKPIQPRFSKKVILSENLYCNYKAVFRLCQLHGYTGDGRIEGRAPCPLAPGERDG
ncbi:MAG: hypothetical protein LUE17_06880, partial [Planctomycetaceae bacterium]|nr:hypothetical protein [Planctomycetaceae bacterium]